MFWQPEFKTRKIKSDHDENPWHLTDDHYNFLDVKTPFLPKSSKLPFAMGNYSVATTFQKQ